MSAAMSEEGKDADITPEVIMFAFRDMVCLLTFISEEKLTVFKVKCMP